MQDIVFIILIVIWIIFSIFLYRNFRTYKLRIWFIENKWDLYNYLPKYDKMLFSFKPLTKAYWVDYAIKQRLKK